MRPLGETQSSVIRSMKQRGGTWHEGCGWLWSTPAGTKRIMESLLKRGLVTKDATTRHTSICTLTVDRYTLTEEGRK